MKFNMLQYLPPQIFSSYKLVDSFPIEDLYKNVKHLPDNFFRQKFDAFKKICLKQELLELDNFIEFIKRSQEFNLPLNNSIVHHIHFLISKNFLTRENFQSIDEFTLLDSTNINFYECYYDYRATHFIPPETTVENNPQFWLHFLTVLLNSEKANKRSEVMKWFHIIRHYIKKLNINVIFDLLILNLLPFNREMTSLLVAVFLRFSRGVKKKYFASEHQRDLLIKVIEKKKIPYPTFGIYLQKNQ